MALRSKHSSRKRLLVHLSQAVETLALTKVPSTVDMPFKGPLNGRVTVQSFEVSRGEFGHFERVSEALTRLDEGTYGTCLSCGRRIEAEMLSAAPWATECKECWDREFQP